MLAVPFDTAHISETVPRVATVTKSCTTASLWI